MTVDEYKKKLALLMNMAAENRIKIAKELKGHICNRLNFKYPTLKTKVDLHNQVKP